MKRSALQVAEIKEMKAMLLCSKTKPSVEDIEIIIDLFGTSFDWYRFIILVKEHRLIPPVYETLRNYLRSYIPTDIYKKIESLRKKNLHQCLTNISAAVKVSRLLNENDIEHLFLKGFSLSLTLYAHPCSRYSGDIDLIVHESMFEKTSTLFGNSGYKQIQSEVELTDENKDLFLSWSHHLAYRCPDTNSKIELHFRFHNVSDFYPMDFTKAWEQKRHINLNGHNLPVLGVHHTLVNLTLHGAGHFWFRLFWLKDISDFFRVHNTTDERLFFDTMTSMNLSRPTAEMLYFLNIFFGNSLPPKARSAIKKDWFLNLAPRIMGHSLKYPKRPSTLILTYFHGIFVHQNFRFNLEKIKKILSTKYHKKKYNPKDKSRLLGSITKR